MSPTPPFSSFSQHSSSRLLAFIFRVAGGLLSSRSSSAPPPRRARPPRATIGYRQHFFLRFLFFFATGLPQYNKVRGQNGVENSAKFRNVGSISLERERGRGSKFRNKKADEFSLNF
jgi:hypothetical protein